MYKDILWRVLLKVTYKSKKRKKKRKYKYVKQQEKSPNKVNKQLQKNHYIIEPCAKYRYLQDKGKCPQYNTD